METENNIKLRFDNVPIDLDTFKQFFNLTFDIDSNYDIVQEEDAFIITLDKSHKKVIEDIKNGITIKRQNYVPVLIHDCRCELILFLIRFYHLISLSYLMIGKQNKSPLVTISNYLDFVPNLDQQPCPKYYLDKFNMPCHHTQSLITNYLFGIPYDDIGQIALTALQTYNYVGLQLINISIWFHRDPLSKYIHHFTVIHQNNIFYLLQSFGQKYGLTLTILSRQDYDSLIHALINITNRIFDDLTLAVYDRYFNNDITIFNNCIISKSNEKNLFSHITRNDDPHVIARIYSNDNFKCAGNTGFCCLTNAVDLIDAHKEKINQGINQYTLHNKFGKKSIKRIIKELRDFEKSRDKYKNQTDNCIGTPFA